MAQTATQIQPIDFGHHDVEENTLRLLFNDCFVGKSWLINRDGLVAVTSDDLFREIEEALVVVNQNELHIVVLTRIWIRICF